MATMEQGKLGEVQKLMDDFALRTGLSGKEGNIARRYLWTDAFAVQTFFTLAHATQSNHYRDLAIDLIDAVHEVLGHFHPDDNRKGWISGLFEEDGKNHPTAGGLRIGKKMPERKKDEPFNERLEWERDGQYFHYLTRWVMALLKAHEETGDQQYAVWAAELLKASEKFIDKSGGRIRMYWKMSVDLSRPLVPSMGAHDPLEGMVCVESVKLSAPEKAAELESFTEDMKKLCSGQDWFTTDDLGIGGLLLNADRVLDLAKKVELPEEIQPQKLLNQSLEALNVYAQHFDKNRPARQRLAFRECGLSLGLRALLAFNEQAKSSGSLFSQLHAHYYLAEEIENFWINEINQQSPTWTDHLDINEISLASSMVAKYYPYTFSGE